jgi:hypothetical protein
MVRRVLTAGALGVLCAAIASASALGDGGPVYVEQGSKGVARGDVRYVTLATNKETVLQMIQRRGGRVLNYMLLPGYYGVPLVAYDGTTDGLSRDGNMLILGDIFGGPQLRKKSSFAVVDVRRFRLLQTIQLRGDFSFDALSPNGRLLYLIQHVSLPQSRYRVRVYDRYAGQLLPKTVTDRRRWQSVMQGVPAGNYPGRPLGLHRLRPEQASVRPCARYHQGAGDLHRPTHAQHAGRP